jgi:hypothetical protein
MPAPQTAFSQYLRLKSKVRQYDAGGRRLGPTDIISVLRGTNAAERKNIWKILCGGWRPFRAQGCDALALAGREKMASSVADVFVVDSAPLLKALAGKRAGLQKELEAKAALVGANGFRYCDLWARLPAAGEPVTFEAAIKEIEAVYEGVFEGGRDFVRGLANSGRLHFEGAEPRCVTPEGANNELVYLPESFKTPRPQEIPVIAHEFGHALHCAYARRLAPGKPFNMVFAEYFSQLFEELAWRRLEAAGKDREALRLGRLEQRVFDGLLTPAVLELEEYAVPAAKRGALTLEKIEAAEDRIFREWFNEPPLDALFWLRSERLFNPELPFHNFVYLAGRALAEAAAQRFARTGRIKRAAFDQLVQDTVELDLRHWLAKYPADAAVIKGAP